MTTTNEQNYRFPQESLEIINNRLKDQYGLFDGLRANWRVVWSSDEKEYRHGTFTRYSPSGLYLGTFEGTMLVPKYNHARDRWILEHLMPVLGAQNSRELASITASYEPVWTFESALGKPLPYKWSAIKLLIEDVVYKVAKRAVGVIEKDPEDDPKISREVKLARIEQLERELFGDETEVGDALAYREGIIVPSSYKGKGE